MNTKKELLVVFILAFLFSYGSSMSFSINSCPPSERMGTHLVFGKVDSIVTIKNKAKMNEKEFKGIKGSRIYWKEKYQIRIAADSSFGINPDSSALLVYAGEYRDLPTDEPAYSMENLRKKLETQTVFEFSKYKNEYVLVYTWEKSEPPCQEEDVKSTIKNLIDQKTSE